MAEQESQTGLTRLTIDFIVPCALVSSMLRGFSLEVFSKASPIIVTLAIMIPASALVTFLYFKIWPGTNPAANGAATALASVPNSFYIPLPLALAVVPAALRDEAAVLVSAAVLAINPLQWTMGTFLVTSGAPGAVRRDWKQSLLCVLNGPIIGIIAGALMALLPPLVSAAHGEPGSFIPLRLLFGAMTLAGQGMAPLSMIVLGTLIAECSLRKAISFRLLAPIFLLRFLIVPGIAFLLIKSHQIPATGVTAFVLMLECASAPATNLAIAARRFNGDWETASALLLVSNIASIAFLPIWMAVGLQL